MSAPVSPTLPCGVRPRGREIAPKPLRGVGIPHLLTRGHAGPLDVEAHPPVRGGVKWKSRWYRPVIGDGQVVHAEAGRSGAGFDKRRAVWDPDGPEETSGAESRIEIVQLIRKVRGSLPS